MQLRQIGILTYFILFITDVYAHQNSDLSALTQPLCLMNKIGGKWFVKSFTAQDEGGMMSYASNNPNITVNAQSGEITASTEGTATITVIQAANRKYKAASGKCILNIEKASSLLSMPAIEKTFGDDDFDLAVPQSKSTGAITYTSSDNTVAEIIGRHVRIVGANENGIMITATQAADGKYKQSSAQTKMIVRKALANLSIEMYYPSEQHAKREVKVVVTSPSKQPEGLVKLYIDNVYFEERHLQSNCTGWPGYGCVYFYIDVNKRGVIRAEYDGGRNYQGASAHKAVLQNTVTFANKAGVDIFYCSAERHRLPKLDAGPGKGRVHYRIDTKPLGIARLDVEKHLIIIEGVGTATVTATKSAEGSYNEASDTYKLTIYDADKRHLLPEKLQEIRKPCGYRSRVPPSIWEQ